MSAPCICGPEWRNPECDQHGNHAVRCVAPHVCSYCDEPMDKEPIDLNGQQFCSGCAKCGYCGAEAVTRKPSLMCEQCLDDHRRAERMEDKRIRLTEGE